MKPGSALAGRHRTSPIGSRPQAAPPAVTALLPIMAVVFFVYLVIGLAMPVLPLHVHQGLGLSTFVVGLVAGSQFAAALISRPWAGHYADRRGAKRAVVAGLVVAVTTGLAYLLSLRFAAAPETSVTILIVGRALLGIGESFIITGALSWGLALMGPQNTGKVMSWIGTALYAAYAVGALAGTALMQGVALLPSRSRRCWSRSPPWRWSCRSARFRRSPRPVYRSPGWWAPCGCRASPWQSAASASAPSPPSSRSCSPSAGGSRSGSPLPP